MMMMMMMMMMITMMMMMNCFVVWLNGERRVALILALQCSDNRDQTSFFDIFFVTIEISQNLIFNLYY